MKKLITSICALACMVGLVAAQTTEFTVTSAVGTSPLSFVQDNLAGGGVYIFNAKHQGKTVNVTTPNLGTFNTNGSDAINMESGIVLTTDHISCVTGGYDMLTAEQRIVCPYIDEMDPVKATECSILEFDFVCLSNHISFNYCFASEEYQGYTCSAYNDMFIFLCSGPDPETGEETMRNIALIPGSQSDANPDGLPVGVNTLNSGSPSGYNSEDDCVSLDYSMYFVQNKDKTYPEVHFNGFTNKLKAEADIVPCALYHMYISICNLQDWVLQSAVFIEGNSFDAPSTAIGLSRTGVGTISGSCPFAIPLSLAGTGFDEGTINITTKGSAVQGVDYELYDEENNLVTNSFAISEKERTLYVKAKKDVDLTNNKTLELCFATSLCASYPQLIVYDTQRFEMVKGNDIKVGDTTISAELVCFEVEAPLRYGLDEQINYRWEPTTGIDNPFARKSTAMITSDATYHLYATGGNGCNTSVATVQVKIGEPGRVDISDVLENGSRVAVDGGMITIEGQQLMRIEVYGTDGRLMAERDCNEASQVSIDASAWQSGVYGVRIVAAAGTSAAKVVVAK